MNRRLILATVAVALATLTAGCFGGGISDEQLDEDADYDWDTEEDAVVDIHETGSIIGDAEYKAVYNVSDRDSIAIYRRGITSDSPVDIRAVQYRRADGTFVNGSELSVSRGDDRTVVDLPGDDGQLAFTAETESKSLTLPAYVDGSHRVILPEDHRADDFLLGDISPRGGYETEEIDDRLHIVWGDVDSRVYVRYYVDRDRYLFYGFALSLGVVGLAGYVLFNRQIRRLRERREEYGLTLDEDDLDDERPPPGMG